MLRQRSNLLNSYLRIKLFCSLFCFYVKFEQLEQFFKSKKNGFWLWASPENAQSWKIFLWNFLYMFQVRKLSTIDEWWQQLIRVYICIYVCFFWFCTFSVLFLRKNKPIENLDFGFGLYLKECTKVDYII